MLIVLVAGLCGITTVSYTHLTGMNDSFLPGYSQPFKYPRRQSGCPDRQIKHFSDRCPDSSLVRPYISIHDIFGTYPSLFICRTSQKRKRRTPTYRMGEFDRISYEMCIRDRLMPDTLFRGSA